MGQAHYVKPFSASFSHFFHRRPPRREIFLCLLASYLTVTTSYLAGDPTRNNSMWLNRTAPIRYLRSFRKTQNAPWMSYTVAFYSDSAEEEEKVAPLQVGFIIYSIDFLPRAKKKKKLFYNLLEFLPFPDISGD